MSEERTSWTCSCGRVNDGKFCTACGKPRPVSLRKDGAAAAPAPHLVSLRKDEAPGAPAPSAQPAPPVPPAPQPAPYGPRAAAPDAERTLRAMCAAFVAALALIVGALGYGYAGVSSQPASAPQAAAPTASEASSSSSAPAKAPAKEEKKDDAKKAMPDFSDIPPGSAQAALVGYYDDITKRNMQSAYGRLSDAMQNQMGVYENFASGYETTISSQASEVKVVSSSDTQASLSYLLTSKDRTDSGKTKVQTFRGQATLQKGADGAWKIADMNVKKQGERME